jgi:hypothetical protein
LKERTNLVKDRVAIIANSLWQRRFGSDPAIINKTILTNGIQRTVIGVLPEGFNYPKGAEVYSPIAVTPELLKQRQNHSFYVIGRLKDGVSLAAHRRTSTPLLRDWRQNIRTATSDLELRFIRLLRIRPAFIPRRCGS